jgi:hypothetical protein
MNEVQANSGNGSTKGQGAQCSQLRAATFAKVDQLQRRGGLRTEQALSLRARSERDAPRVSAG